MIRRRDFMTLLGGAAAAWPLPARAQQPRRNWRVGVLAAGQPPAAVLSLLRDALRERGYVEGQNLAIDVRWPQDSLDREPQVAAEMARSVFMTQTGSRFTRVQDV